MKESNRITLSDQAYHKYYNRNNFYSLFIGAFVESKSYIGNLISIAIGICFLLFVDISQIAEPRELLKAISAGLITYSITVIGFLIVAFTLLIVLNSSKSIFHYFAIEQSKYKRPLISILLSTFIVPIGVFILLFGVSIFLSFAIPIFGVESFRYKDKVIIFKILTGTIVALFIFSVLEFLAFFHNIFKFIVLSSYDAAKTFEQETIKERVLPDLKDSATLDRNLIEQNAREKIKKLKEDGTS